MCESAEWSRCGVRKLTRAAYATAYDACTEIANFKSKSGIRGLRYVGAIHVACLLIMFFDGRLAMPCTDMRM